MSLLYVAEVGCSQARNNLTPGDDGWGFDSRWDGARAEPPVPPRQRVIPPEERVAWEHRDLLRELSQVGGREPSEHFGGGYDRTVLVDSRAEPYRDMSGESVFARGALIVQRHHPPGSPDVVMMTVAQKMATGSLSSQCDWDLLVLDQELKVAARGELEMCARCHSEAPHNCLFGPPESLSD